MNIRLFFQLIIIESILMGFGLFGLILFWFLYFGSGAGASSKKAIMTQKNTMLAILVLLPLLFGVFKYKNSDEKKRRISYLFAGLFVTIVSGIYLYLTA